MKEIQLFQKIHTVSQPKQILVQEYKYKCNISIRLLRTQTTIHHKAWLYSFKLHFELTIFRRLKLLNSNRLYSRIFFSNSRTFRQLFVTPAWGYRLLSTIWRPKSSIPSQFPFFPFFFVILCSPLHNTLSIHPSTLLWNNLFSL